MTAVPKLDIEFFEEPVLSVKDEALPLLAKHWTEIAWNRAQIPLDPDWERYGQIERAGKFVCYTLRAKGKLVGYSAYFVDKHLHYRQTTFALNDVLYIDPAYRGRKGTGFILWCERRLKARGAQVHGLHIKHSFNWSKLAERIGFQLMDYIYMKWL